jgi:uncharacterized alkaline shock family protein YloU
VTEGQASISTDILARYAADAAREVGGVHGLVGRRAVRIDGDGGELHVELHLAIDWGASIPDVGRTVQRRVREYLARMADIRGASVDVVVDEVGVPPHTTP